MSYAISRVAVVGLGTMGQGIAVAAAAAGKQVFGYDRPEQLRAGLTVARRRHQRALAAAGGSDGASGDAGAGRIGGLDIRGCDSVAAAVRDADLVIEAVSEDLDVKCTVLREIAAAAPQGVPLATNTSSLPLAVLADAVADQRRFLATHFFNPAELVPGVEVAVTPATDAAVTDRVMSFLTEIGKDPIRVGAGVGFVANRLQMALFLEAMACVEDGSATPDDVDGVVRRTFGFRLPAYGPFAIADMAGLDVYASILRTLRDAYGDRFSVPEAVRRLTEAGRHGVKAGAGFRDYPAEAVEALLRGRDERYRQLLRAADEPAEQPAVGPHQQQ